MVNWLDFNILDKTVDLPGHIRELQIRLPDNDPIVINAQDLVRFSEHIQELKTLLHANSIPDDQFAPIIHDYFYTLRASNLKLPVDIIEDEIKITSKSFIPRPLPSFKGSDPKWPLEPLLNEDGSEKKDEYGRKLCIFPPTWDIPMLTMGWFGESVQITPQLAYAHICICEWHRRGDIVKLRKPAKILFRDHYVPYGWVKKQTNEYNKKIKSEFKRSSKTWKEWRKNYKIDNKHIKECENCGALFVASRVDARACPMSACKKALSRKNKIRKYQKKSEGSHSS